MRVLRVVARAIGWVFVAVIGYHAVLAVVEGVRAAHDGSWADAAELIAIAIVAGAIVVAAIVGARTSALRSASRSASRPARSPARRPGSPRQRRPRPPG